MVPLVPGSTAYSWAGSTAYSWAARVWVSYEKEREMQEPIVYSKSMPGVGAVEGDAVTQYVLDETIKKMAIAA